MIKIQQIEICSDPLKRCRQYFFILSDLFIHKAFFQWDHVL